MLDYSSMMNEMNFIDMPRDKYVNSGILLMNLKSMRMNNVEKKIRDFINKHFLNHHDQTAINGVCYNNWEVLSIKYACFNFDDYSTIVKYNKELNEKYRYSAEELKQAFYEPTLLHFGGYDKPWNLGSSRPKNKYWWYYAKKSGLYEEILNHYNFKKDDVEQQLHAIPKDGGLIKKNYL